MASPHPGPSWPWSRPLSSPAGYRSSLHAWGLLWVCVAIVVLAIPAGKMIGIMDDTVDWGSTPAATSDPQLSGPEADRGRDQPALEEMGPAPR